MIEYEISIPVIGRVTKKVYAETPEAAKEIALKEKLPDGIYLDAQLTDPYPDEILVSEYVPSWHETLGIAMIRGIFS